MDYKKAFIELRNDLETLREHHNHFSHDSYDENAVKSEVLYTVMKQLDKYIELIEEDIETKKDYEFKGWSEYELLEVFGLDEDYCGSIDNEIMYNELLMSYLMENIEFNTDKNEPNSEAYYQVRRYMEKLVEYDTEYSKVFKAMLEIDSDLVFKQFIFALIGHMWT